MARAANLGGIGRRGLPAKIEAEIVAGRAVRDVMTDVPTEVLAAEDLKVATKEDTKAGPAAAADARSMGSPKSSSRS